jgi:hypothetical protein
VNGEMSFLRGDELLCLLEWKEEDSDLSLIGRLYWQFFVVSVCGMLVGFVEKLFRFLLSIQLSEVQLSLEKASLGLFS